MSEHSLTPVFDKKYLHCPVCWDLLGVRVRNHPDAIALHEKNKGLLDRPGDLFAEPLELSNVGYGTEPGEPNT